jgi:hypothetical protein
MPISISEYLRKIASSIRPSYRVVTASDLKELGLKVDKSVTPKQNKILYDIVSQLPQALIKRCNVAIISFEDLGPSAKYYPNHGKYKPDGGLVLNSRIFDDPPTTKDDEGIEVPAIRFVLLHEMGHGFDKREDNGREMSLDEDWLKLSGWSEEPKKGLMRVKIQEKGYPKVMGEWYYSPKAGFARFYGRRNPWDDWADSFAYHLLNCKSQLPEGKVAYFDKKLESYLKKA